MADKPPPAAAAPPLAPGLLPNVRFDLLSGFLVFLIAMPLCLGIAKASQYPPIAGIWTAVIGGVLTTFLSNSQLTIKGPAAGLIVIVAGAVTSLGKEAVQDLPAADVTAIRAKAKQDQKNPDEAVRNELAGRQIAAGYPLALGCALVAGVMQTLSGLFKAGTLGELVPLTPVHGMLASIGITIMAKQVFPMLGITTTPPADAEPIMVIGFLLGAKPGGDGTLDFDPLSTLGHWTPMVAVVGLTSLAMLIVFPFLKARVPALKAVPAQVVVLAAAIPLGLGLGLSGRALVKVPEILYSADVLAEVQGAFHWPDFRAVLTVTGLLAVVKLWLIASIESMLSSQAVDLIDPWKRKTDQNRDLLATGVGNTVCAAVGALPMISEIVRSKANIDNGARTKAADLFHGLFLLAFVLLLPMVINIIPLAALGAMLVFVGFRLASPREFISTYKIGPEQLFVFVATILVTLSTDLLVGVVSGIALELLIHLVNGAPITGLLKPKVEVVVEGPDGPRLIARQACVFSNWLGLRAAITSFAADRQEVVLDLSHTKLVDHSVMEKLHDLEREFAEHGKTLTLTGLDGHTPMSSHPLSARRRRDAGRVGDESTASGPPV